MRAWKVPAPVRRYAQGWWVRDDGQWPRRYRWTVPIVGLLISVRALDDGGWFVAGVAVLLWTGLTISTLRGLPERVTWSRAHPVLDSLIMVPAAFVALATLTQLGLAWCGLLSVLL